MVVGSECFRSIITTEIILNEKRFSHCENLFWFWWLRQPEADRDLTCIYSTARDASRAYSNSALDVGNARSTFLNNPCNTLPGPTSMTSAQPSAII